MIGNKHNNKFKSQKSPLRQGFEGQARFDETKARRAKVKSQAGQVLLITIMLIATALTVALSISFKSTTETQVTKLEEESQRALAAAEAGIEAALKQSGSVPIGASLSEDLGAFSGTALCSETYDKTYFVSPLLQIGEQYVFYLADYPGFANPYTDRLSIYYGSSDGISCNDISLEITLISNNTVSKKWIADQGNHFGSDIDDLAGGASGSLGEESFNCRTSPSIDLSSYSNPQLLLVRTFFQPTKIGLSGGASLLKPQGKTCDSQASSTATNVTKKVTLFQSYPQIPAEFFVTSF